MARGRVSDEGRGESMGTVNRDRTRRRMAEMEDELTTGKVRKEVPEAAELFVSARSIEPSTGRKYRRIMERLKSFAAGRRLATVDAITLEHLDAYRLTRKLNPLGWAKELQPLRTFFSSA